MEQQSGLTFGQSSRPETPVSDSSSKPAKAESVTEDAPSASSSTATLKPATEGSGGALTNETENVPESLDTAGLAVRAQQHGLYQGSLEDEVGQVVNQLSSWGGSFWGLAKKQGASALQAARSDIDKTVKQAKEEYSRLQTQTVEVVRKEKAHEAEIKAEADGPSTSEKGKAKEVEASTEAPLATASAAASNLFAKLTSTSSAIQANLQQTLQATLDAHPNLPTNPTRLRQTLAQNLHLASARENLDLSLKQAEKLAEEYLKKSEGFMSEAGEWVKEAVKVVPPQDGEDRPGVVWDGTDMYAFSTSATTTKSSNAPWERSASQLYTSASASPADRATMRKQALLRRLRSDKDLLLVNPAGEAETDERRAAFADFVTTQIEARGGSDGDVVRGEIWAELGPEGSDVEELKGLRDELVPSQLSTDEFWKRYFFHKSSIEKEEEKRRQLLDATAPSSTDDDFSWDDNDDSESTTSPAVASETSAADEAREAAQRTPKASASEKMPSNRLVGASTETSPRDSSEDSYDVVSDQPDVKTPAPPVKETKKGADDSDDSDWE